MDTPVAVSEDDSEMTPVDEVCNNLKFIIWLVFVLKCNILG